MIGKNNNSVYPRTASGLTESGNKTEKPAQGFSVLFPVTASPQTADVGNVGNVGKNPLFLFFNFHFYFYFSSEVKKAYISYTSYTFEANLLIASGVGECRMGCRIGVGV